MTQAIVVVGAATLTCLGRELASTWSGLIAGRSGIRRHASLDPQFFLQDIAGLVTDPPVDPFADDANLSRLPARSIHLAVSAARDAWTDAGLKRADPRLDPARVAVVLGSALGGVDMLEAESERLAKRKSLSVSPYLIPGLIINQAAGQVALHLGLHGPSIAPSNACSTGGHAIALGALLLRSGEADVAVCGGCESAFTPPIVNGFATMKALIGRKPEDRSAADPNEASRPFSADRAGFVMSEGAGVIILATTAAAERLELRPRAALLGWCSNSDAYHMAAPHPGRIAECLAGALRHAGVNSSDIDYYNAHGTSTVVNDRVETQALKQVFGPHAGALPVSSIKGAIGHALGAAAAIEAAVCVRALEDQLVPPTIHYLADPELDLDYVPNTARSATLNAVMSASFGFGGTNNVLIFGRIEA